MARYGWNSIKASPRMPLSGQTVNGTPFSVPRGARTMTIFVPDLAGGAATLKIQALDRTANDPETTETWRDVSAFIIATGGGVVALASIPESAATTIPTTGLGGGVIRFVASADQSGAATNIGVEFHMGA